MKKQTAVVIGSLLLIVLFIIIAQVYVRREAQVSIPESKTQELPPPPTEAQPTAVSTKTQAVSEMTVVIDFGNGTRWTDKATGATVYEATVQLIKAKGATFEEKQYKFGKMIEKIGSLGNTKDGYWSYSVNDKAGQVAADKKTIYPDDRIEWKYIKQ